MNSNFSLNASNFINIILIKIIVIFTQYWQKYFKMYMEDIGQESQENSILKMSMLPKFIYKFNTIKVKIDNWIIKFIWKFKTTVRNENKVENLL